RHSKNAGDRHHFTYREREGCGYGTQKVRVGVDSQLPFGNCAMCLRLAKEPMATPSGHIYCRECILEYLLVKTKDLKRQRAAYEAQQQAQAERAVAADAEKQQRSVDKFVKTQGAVGPLPPPAAAASASTSSSTALVVAETGGALVAVASDDSAAPAAALGKRAHPEDAERRLESEKKRVMAKMALPVDMTTREQHKEILKRTSFWLPTHAPEHVEERVAPPEARPRSPMSGDPLRAKNLIPVRFTVDGGKEEAGADSGGAGKGRIICAVTRREIHHQPTVLLARSGQVMLKSAAEEFALPTMMCPVTGGKFKTADVIELARSASGFAASGEVEAQKYEPVM
ncbi:hypothetical protein JKP88DRAFT_308871, partial [Tribonema minus]